MQLSTLSERKFTDSIELPPDWKISTDTGWQPITHIYKTIPYQKYKITLENGYFLECADTHILFDAEYNQIYAKDCICYVTSLVTSRGIYKVISKEIFEQEEEMYDISVDSEDHRFFSNEILSHNTLTMSCYLIWFTLFNDNKISAILANRGATSREIMRKCQDIYENLPIWLQQGVQEFNKSKMILENGSIIMAESTSSSAIRGYAVNCIVLDEFAFVSNTLAENFFTSVYPTISSGESTKIFISSTPLGLNHFYKMYMDGLEGRNGFKVLKVTWDQVPGRTKAWADDQRKVLGEIKFMQEMEADFQGSSNTLISAHCLKNIVYLNAIHIKDELDIYFAPEQNHVYIATVDVSRGQGIDYSAMLVFDVTIMPYQVVAKYKSNSIPPMLYPNIILKVCKDYNEAKVLIEINDIGGQVADILNQDLEYEHVIYTDRDIISEWGKQGMAGIRTTVKTRRIGCANLKQLLENDKLMVNDFDIVAELSTFTIYKGKYQAEQGTHDDLVMCLILFSFLATSQFFKDFTDDDVRKLMYSQQEMRIDQELTPFGFILNGIDDDDIIDITPTDVWLTGNQDYENYLKQLGNWD